MKKLGQIHILRSRYQVCQIKADSANKLSGNNKT